MLGYSHIPINLIFQILLSSQITFLYFGFSFSFTKKLFYSFSHFKSNLSLLLVLECIFAHATIAPVVNRNVKRNPNPNPNPNPNLNPYPTPN